MLGCAAGSTSGDLPDPSSDGGAGGNPAANTGAGATMNEKDPNPDPGPPCQEETQYVYVLGHDDMLYRFDPPTLELEPLGLLPCGPTGPFSMAIDRLGVAWIPFVGGGLYRLDLETMECTPTNFYPEANLVDAFKKFGMAFVADDQDSPDEQLFVGSFYPLTPATEQSCGLGRIDTQSLTLSMIGAYTPGSGRADFTGTGDGRLYGFFDAMETEPDVWGAAIAEIDRTTAAILSVAPQPIDVGLGWAFAFWGGDFYLFTSPDDVTSQISRYRPSDATTTTLKTGITSLIVGAGVSTCVPLEPPH